MQTGQIKTAKNYVKFNPKVPIIRLCKTDTKFNIH